MYGANEVGSKVATRVGGVEQFVLKPLLPGGPDEAPDLDDYDSVLQPPAPARASSGGVGRRNPSAPISITETDQSSGPSDRDQGSAPQPSAGRMLGDSILKTLGSVGSLVAPAGPSTTSSSAPLRPHEQQEENDGEGSQRPFGSMIGAKVPSFSSLKSTLKVLLPGGGADQQKQQLDQQGEPPPPPQQQQQQQPELGEETRKTLEPSSAEVGDADPSAALDTEFENSLQQELLASPLPPPSERPRKLAYTIAVSGWAWEDSQFRQASSTFRSLCVPVCALLCYTGDCGN